MPLTQASLNKKDLSQSNMQSSLKQSPEQKLRISRNSKLQQVSQAEKFHL
jgi:hypothetical protein